MSTASRFRRPDAARIVRRFDEWSADRASIPPPLRVFEPEDADGSRTVSESIRWDVSEFEQAPRAALRRVRRDVLLNPNQRGPMTQQLFPMLVEGPPARRRLVYETLKEFAEPQDILIGSLLLYHRVGDAEPLVIGAGLLEDLGARSWPVLAAYAMAARPECASFAPAIARLDGVPAKDRLTILEILARSSDAELRWRACEALDELALEGTNRGVGRSRHSR